jgi:hypothetical protein
MNALPATAGVNVSRDRLRLWQVDRESAALATMPIPSGCVVILPSAWMATPSRQHHTRLFSMYSEHGGHPALINVEAGKPS